MSKRVKQLEQQLEKRINMYRWDVINHLAQQIGATSYLEIGLYASECFNAVQCEHKVSVDPKAKKRIDPTFVMTSDQFFDQNKETFDIIFIDGLHENKQAYRDIINSLKYLNDGGVIVVHDCNPCTELAQKIPRDSQCWTGDVWKAWVQLRQELDKQMFVIDTDCGCGIIRDGQATKFVSSNPTYKDLKSNRTEMLNLISIEKFLCG